jgi:azurin
MKTLVRLIPLLFVSIASLAQASAISLTVQTAENNLMFNPKSLTVHAGQDVTLTFKNTATADSGLSHSLAVLMPGKADEVSAAGASAGASKGYLADSPDVKKDVIAHTHLVKPGQSETIHFTAPSTPGDYPFICTYPSHFPSMQGTLKVEP